MGRPRRKPSSCGVLDEGWRLPVVLPPLVQRDWRMHRAKGSVFAFAPTAPVSEAGFLCPSSGISHPLIHAIGPAGFSLGAKPCAWTP
jgi:hypothetical protein